MAESVQDSVNLINDFKFFEWKTWEKNTKDEIEIGNKNDTMTDTKF